MLATVIITGIVIIFYFFYGLDFNHQEPVSHEPEGNRKQELTETIFKTHISCDEAGCWSTAHPGRVP